MFVQDIKQKPATIFLHIPKAAGTTLHSIFEREYRGKHICDLDTNNLLSDIEAFKKLSAEEINKIDLLKGHLPFGLHECFTRDFTYVTMMRNPVDRIISHYRYALQKPNHYLHKQITEQNMDIRDYVDSGMSNELDNAMVRILSNHLYDIPFGACNEDMLNLAKSNLVQFFSVIGLLERFDESVLLMKIKLGWKKYPVYHKKNVTRKNQGKKAVDNELINHIRQRNSLDWELYLFATTLFEKELASVSQKIEHELKYFRIINSVYSKLAGFSDSIKSRLRPYIH